MNGSMENVIDIRTSRAWPVEVEVAHLCYKLILSLLNMDLVQFATNHILSSYAPSPPLHHHWLVLMLSITEELLLRLLLQCKNAKQKIVTNRQRENKKCSSICNIRSSALPLSLYSFVVHLKANFCRTGREKMQSINLFAH